MKHIKSIRIWTFMIALVLTQISFAQGIDLPETPAGKMANAFFEAFNAEGNEAMREFTAKNRTKAALERVSLEDRMAQHGQIKGMLKQLEPRKIVKNEDRELTVLVFAEQVDAWFEIGFTLNEDNPPLLEGFALKPTSAPAESSEDEGYGEWKDLSGLLQKVIDKHGIPGISIALIEGGKITETAVAGVREDGGSDKVLLNDKFHIGSITKSMTATLIGKLIEQGKLKASTTLRSVFPKMKMLKAYESVTVEQLLTHTGGLPGYLTVSDELDAELLALPGNAIKQRLAFAERVLNEEPMTKPGTAFAYSNAGYAVLGAISDKLSGKSWEKQLDKVIFSPLKMTTAGTGWPKSAKQMDQPSGHFGALNELRPQKIDEYALGNYMNSAGDVHASMKDLARYALAHLNGVNGQDGILKASTFKQLHTTSENRVYAAGWFVIEEDGKTIHEHSGSAGTFLAMMRLEPELNRGVVIAANAGGLVLDGIFKDLIKIYRGEK